MDTHDSDRLLKRIWLANGLLILLGLVLAGGVALFALISNAIGRRAEAVAAPTTVADPGTRADPRAVRYSMPREVRGTSTRLIHVFHGEAYARAEGYDGSRRQYSLYTSEGPTVNVIFLRPDGTAHLLLDRPAFVRTLDYPDAREDSLQRWIAYEIVTDDSNGDRRLDDQDAAILYLSDVDGTNFRRVMPEGWAVTSHIALQPGQLLISAIRVPAREGGKADEQPQRAFIYDLTTNTLVPHVSLDSIAERAGRVLSRPRP
jgi:hypothetical protein